ncbi:MAG TPA: transposase [Terriglobales bacterium]|nr:transposase [Terriglobales bacterium]
MSNRPALNRLQIPAQSRFMEEQGFDEFCEQRCAKFYAEELGRRGLMPGMYFRLLMRGYFEGIDSERGIAWGAADSLSLRSFLQLSVDEAAPDHSTISRTRRLIDAEIHHEVFAWILERPAEAGLVKGKTLGIDATTLEANAAMRSIVRRETGEGYQPFLLGLAKASGIETPTREDLARLDRKRKGKGSDAEWVNPHEPDGRIAKMKDGSTHLARKAEHAVDMDTGTVVAVALHPADQGDTTTVMKTPAQAGEEVAGLMASETAGGKVNGAGVEEVVADKGYPSDQVLADMQAAGVRTYLPEKKAKRLDWAGKREGRQRMRANRRRVSGRRGKRLLRRRGELIERGFAHAYGTGGMRRTHLRGHANILKRLHIHNAAHYLGLLMRQRFGMGKPRSLQGTAGLPEDFLALAAAISASVARLVAPQPTGALSNSQPALLAACFPWASYFHKSPFPPRAARLSAYF